MLFSDQWPPFLWLYPIIFCIRASWVTFVSSQAERNHCRSSTVSVESLSLGGKMAQTQILRSVESDIRGIDCWISPRFCMQNDIAFRPSRIGKDYAFAGTGWKARERFESEEFKFYSSNTTFTRCDKRRSKWVCLLSSPEESLTTGMEWTNLCPRGLLLT